MHMDDVGKNIAVIVVMFLSRGNFSKSWCFQIRLC